MFIYNRMSQFFTSNTTLSSRLIRILSWLTFSIILLFGCATFIIIYSFETVLFNERLKQAHIHILNNEPLPYNISLITDLEQGEPRLAEKIREFKLNSDKEFGKIHFESKRYHLLITDDGIIVYDTSDVTLIKRAFDDILLILSVMLIPALLLTYWVAKITAKHALKPFYKLTSVFANESNKVDLNQQLIADIEESDVKAIAIELLSALEQKTKLLEQQMAFNQGMAHELRTPLQVMRHSTELLHQLYPTLVDSSALQRLDKAINRMHRLSVGLLWLTSNRVCNAEISAKLSLEGLIEELELSSSKHKVKIEITIHNDLKLKMPSEVFELIMFNLFSNVLHHSQLINDETCWQIIVDNPSIICRNKSLETNVTNLDETHFGVGLDLVTKLVQRFDLEVSYVIDEGHYITQITVN